MSVTKYLGQGSQFSAFIDMQGNQIYNLNLQVLTTPPVGAQGLIYYDNTTTGAQYKARYYNGTSWVNMDGSQAPLAGDVTGTANASTVAKVNGVAVSAVAAVLAAQLGSGAQLSATATLLPGAINVYIGSTAAQTLTLPASPPANTPANIMNLSSVSVTIAAGAANFIDYNGTIGSVVLAAGERIELVYGLNTAAGTQWTVLELGLPARLFLPLVGGTISGAVTFDASVTMSGATIAMGANKITGLANGSAAQDAVAFNQLATATSLYLLLAGGTITGNVIFSTAATSLTFQSTAGIVFSGTGTIAMGANKITGLANGAAAQDAAAFGQIAAAITAGAFLPLAGGTMSGDITMAGHFVDGLGTPTSGSQAATKSYVDNAISGLDPKPSVRVATLVALTATPVVGGLQVVDGITVAAGDRVFSNPPTGNGSGVQAGIWVAATGPWTRPADFATTSLQNGAYVMAEQGALNAGAGFVLTGTYVEGASGPQMQVDVSLETWVQFSKVVGSPVSKYVTTITGTGPWTVTHNLNSQSVVVSFVDSSAYANAFFDWTAPTVNTILVSGIALGALIYNVTVVG